MNNDKYQTSATGRCDDKDGACDVLIIGAGPVGLSLSLSLRGLGLDVRLIERQPLKAIATPQFDGREIALSHRSVDILQNLGAWKRIAPDEISPLKSAKVTNGGSQARLHFDARAVGADKLGFLVSNHNIRRALYDEHLECGEACLITGAEATPVKTSGNGSSVTLADGRMFCARLLVAADTRFSTARRAAGISASQHDFGKTMIVSRMKFEHPHNHVAWECFLPGGALAILPLNANEASIVQTFAPEEAARQMALGLDDYAAAAGKRLKGRFGALHPASERCAYPLVSVYANRFAASGFALVGDAAVGMHPVTAHGFNLGVQGQDILARQLRRALGCNRGIADAGALKAYERAHQKLSRPLYWSTLALAELYARETPVARLARRAIFDVGRALPPARKLIMKNLTQPLASAEMARQTSFENY